MVDNYQQSSPEHLEGSVQKPDPTMVAFLRIYPCILRLGMESFNRVDPVKELSPAERNALYYAGILEGREIEIEDPLQAWTYLNSSFLSESQPPPALYVVRDRKALKAQ
jgi:hypothetical protein